MFGTVLVLPENSQGHESEMAAHVDQKREGVPGRDRDAAPVGGKVAREMSMATILLLPIMAVVCDGR